jgi:hypothetical protein
MFNETVPQETNPDDAATEAGDGSGGDDKGAEEGEEAEDAGSGE